MPPGSAQGQDLARQRAIDSAGPRWQRGINGFNANPGEEQDPPRHGSVQGQEYPRAKDARQLQGKPHHPISGHQRDQQRAHTKGKHVKGIVVGHPPAPRIPKERGSSRVHKNKKVKPTSGAPSSPSPRMPRRQDGRQARGYMSRKGKKEV